MGVKDGMDILTMSLGGADGWTEGTGTVVSSRIAATGKIVTIAAGNDVRLFYFVSTEINACAGCIRFMVYIGSGKRNRRDFGRFFGQHRRPTSGFDGSWCHT